MSDKDDRLASGSSPVLGEGNGHELRPVELKFGTVLDGKYKIVDVIASGGTGRIYKAEHLLLSCPVAIKVLLPEFASDAKGVARFKQEALAISRLNHANIVAVHAFGVYNGQPFIVMDYIEGRNLACELTSAGTLALPVFFQIFLQIARALEHAHGKGVIHRDIKPGNILLEGPRDRVIARLVDFGIAKLESSPMPLTTSGTLLGSIWYMSPEQAIGAADARSDIYSLGCVMYESLCGSPPLCGESAYETVYRRKQESVPPPSSINACIPPELDQVLLRALAISADERFQNAWQLIADLERTQALLPLPVVRQKHTQPAKPSNARTALNAYLLAMCASLLVGMLYLGFTENLVRSQFELLALSQEIESAPAGSKRLFQAIYKKAKYFADNKRFEEALKESTTLLDIATRSTQMGSGSDEALQALSLKGSVLASLKNPLEEADLYRRHFFTLQGLKMWRPALKAGDLARKASVAVQDHDQTTWIEFGLSQCYFALGEKEKSRSLFLKVMVDAKRWLPDADQLSLINQRMNALIQAGETYEAVSLVKPAYMAIASADLDDKLARATAQELYISCAVAHLHAGNKTESLRHYQRAKSCWRPSDSKPVLAGEHVLMGHTFLMLDYPAEAETACRKGLQVAGSDAIGRAQQRLALLDLTFIYCQRRNLKAAEQLATRNVSLLDENASSSERVKILTQAGEVFAAAGKAKEALDYFEQAAHSADLPADTVSTKARLGQHYIVLEELEKAEAYLKEALSLQNGLGNADNLAGIMLGFGDLCFARERTGEAVAYYDRLLALVEPHLPKNAIARSMCHVYLERMQRLKQMERANRAHRRFKLAYPNFDAAS